VGLADVEEEMENAEREAGKFEMVNPIEIF